MLKTVPSVEYDAIHFTILTLTYISGRKERADIQKGYELGMKMRNISTLRNVRTEYAYCSVLRGRMMLSDHEVSIPYVTSNIPCLESIGSSPKHGFI